MADDALARFARLSRQAKLREAIRRAVERDNRLTWAERRGAEEVASHTFPAYLAGPPDGCTECYVWVSAKLAMNKLLPASWFWTHKYMEDEWCNHPCHGPAGMEVPTILLA